jgi:hypothetical protein
MVELSRPHAGVVGPLSPEAALAVLRHIMNVWELDWLDATALVGGTTNDMKTIEWTEDRRLRAAYLSELEKALIGLNSKTGIARWIATPNPGPFFAGNSPLQVITGGHVKWRDCYAKSGNGLVASYDQVKSSVCGLRVHCASHDRRRRRPSATVPIPPSQDTSARKWPESTVKRARASLKQQVGTFSVSPNPMTVGKIAARNPPAWIARSACRPVGHAVNRSATG